MTLSKHIDADDLIQQAQDHPYLSFVQRPGGAKKRAAHSGPFGGRYQTQELPKYSFPSIGISDDAAYQLISSELALDGRPTLNLASFVHTYMNSAATKLIMENISVNLADQDEYPATMTIHGRCISMLADLWHAPKEIDPATGKRHGAMGTATAGSSEAIMLGGLAMKKRWQEKMKAAGKDYKNPGPNVVFGSNAQVAIEKFARYFDVEERLVPISKESHYCFDPKKAIKMVDENTIGAIIILGSTYTGHFEPVKEMADLLDEYEKNAGHDIPIHVDGASGAMVAPFAFPDLEWDFKIPRVKSINTSGHKFGMVYCGIGWIIWRSADFLPKDLIFELHYLGSVEYSFNLNFSRPAAPVLGQYYNFINLGFEGYRNVMMDDLKNARIFSRALEASGYYEVLSDIHRPASVIASADTKVGSFDESECRNYAPGLPVVSFKWTDGFKTKYPHLQQHWIQTLLRVKGWIVPNYSLSAPMTDVEILRVVVRENLSEDMIDLLVHDLMSITESLTDNSSPEASLASVISKSNKTTADKHAHGPTNIPHHKHHPRHQHSLEKGSGTKAVGYAKQC
ncbi:glutamate decarboxylase [Tilletiaria anomala UBC 951]|uniref:Glutamate decarboxylase n=1 Tax=Tilletiaria anomala (strain ATCC 24038 / CBS 436.72 / UBC 951) TaxID=1037660 RepID=A0A066WKM2_TILAU|nr:glutamate decarboxylase [Tilletiaria anomala UBC 951]KDN53133.1 glutamate decarboxylase [Tilletiaria anomala UBC 951]